MVDSMNPASALVLAAQGGQGPATTAPPVLKALA